MEIVEPFVNLKFPDEIHTIKLQEIPQTFEHHSHNLFQDEEINASSSLIKNTRKLKRRKLDPVDSLKDLGKNGEKGVKNISRVVKHPFRIITEMQTPDDRLKEVQLPPLKVETESPPLKSVNNELSLSSELIPKNEKQERNRVCARKCRLRKKMYLETIEKENRDLKDEIVKYRKELNAYKAREEAGLLNNLSINAIKTDYLEKLRTNNTATAKEMLHNYMVTQFIKNVGRERSKQ